MQIILDDLTGPEIAQLLSEHMADMHSVSPPESCHVLGIDSLRSPDVTFWSGWEDSQLLGCGALQELPDQAGEIKSMRTAEQHLRKGVAAKLLQHIIEEAKRRGYRQLLLETGSMQEFTPARELYRRFGFVECPPFGSYVEDPNSVYFRLTIANQN